MFFLKLILLLNIYLLTRLLPKKGFVLYALVAIGVMQAIVAILQQINLIESRHFIFSVTGFFGNPGQMGGFQAVACVAALSLLSVCKGKGCKHLLLLASVVVTYSLILADSRASFVALLAGLVAIYWRNFLQVFHKYKWLVFPIVIAVASLSVFYVFLSRKCVGTFNSFPNMCGCRRDRYMFIGEEKSFCLFILVDYDSCFCYLYNQFAERNS